MASTSSLTNDLKLVQGAKAETIMAKDLFAEIARIGKDQHPRGDQDAVQYGTAGFRTRAERLDHVMYRMGVLASLRSKAKLGNVIGVMITASHNPAPDNGVKLVDPAGEMLEQSWEAIATKVANASDDDLGEVVKSIVSNLEIDLDCPATVFVGRDTRPSSKDLSKAVLDGVTAAQGAFVDYKEVSTPQLHYFVVCKNTDNEYGEHTITGYFEKLASAYKDFRGKTQVSGNYSPHISFDGANGVGAIAMQGLNSMIQLFQRTDLLNVELFNGNSEDGSKLNFECGADFVKTNQKAPEGMPVVVGKRCVSVDGDADRVVYYYTDEESHKFVLLDGDRIATLIAGFLKELLALSGLSLDLGLVQTAYANGNSTNYITSKLNVPVACTSTGVKHLHHKALDFDIGVYFEANGHGTVVYSDSAQDSIKKAAKEGSEAAQKLKLFMDMTNQCVGDALSDMLLVETVLFAKGWSAKDWANAYTDLPNRMTKVLVANRNVITTTDAERKVVKPEGLQAKIDETVKKFTDGRSFVRPSGTEDIVRVYAEADTQDNADQLAYEVGLLVHELAGGVGEPTPKFGA